MLNKSKMRGQKVSTQYMPILNIPVAYKHPKRLPLNFDFPNEQNADTNTEVFTPVQLGLPLPTQRGRSKSVVHAISVEGSR